MKMTEKKKQAIESVLRNIKVSISKDVYSGRYVATTNLVPEVETMSREKEGLIKKALKSAYENMMYDPSILDRALRSIKSRQLRENKQEAKKYSEED